MNVLDSWHIYCFIVHFAYLFLSLLKKTNCPGFLAYLLFYCIFCMSTSFFILKKKKWMSWILGIFIVLLYKWIFFFFFHFLFVEILSDDALTLELDMSTPTPIEVDDWLLLFGWVVLMTTYWVSLVFILTTYWCVDLKYWYVDFLLLDTNRQWPTSRCGFLFWVFTVAYI